MCIMILFYHKYRENSYWFSYWFWKWYLWLYLLTSYNISIYSILIISLPCIVCQSFMFVKLTICYQHSFFLPVITQPIVWAGYFYLSFLVRQQLILCMSKLVLVSHAYIPVAPVGAVSGDGGAPRCFQCWWDGNTVLCRLPVLRWVPGLSFLLCLLWDPVLCGLSSSALSHGWICRNFGTKWLMNNLVGTITFFFLRLLIDCWFQNINAIVFVRLVPELHCLVW